jgi:hypothetical protein
MGTTNNFDSPASGALAATDTFPIISAATSAAATATLAQLATYVGGGAAGYVAGGSTKTLVAADNGKTVRLDTLTGSVVTLPAATGTGARFKFLVTVLATSNSHVVKVANATDFFIGMILGVSDDPATVKGWIAANSGTVATNSDTVTLNRTTTGSVAVGEWIEVEDVATATWAIRGQIAQTGTEATPFTAGV